MPKGQQKVAILDAGAQYGKLIDRRVRELNVVGAFPCYFHALSAVWVLLLPRLPGTCEILSLL